MSEPVVHIWRLEGHKAGDNAQLRYLSDALMQRFGWSSQAIPMNYRPYELMLHCFAEPSLAGLTSASRQLFAPPWPTLVLTAGRRNELPGRWLAMQARARLIHIGRPWSDPKYFDLVLTTPQYSLPGGANILATPFPLVSPATAQPGPEWVHQLQHLPRPFTAVLIGGNSGPYVFHSMLGRQLAVAINQAIEESGGSAFIVTSRRTPSGFAADLQKTLCIPHYYVNWQSQRNDAISYNAVLALADEFIVTADSISMVMDAMATGQPTSIFDLERYPFAGWRRINQLRWKPLTHWVAQNMGPPRMRRHVRQLLQSWVDNGYLQWLHQRRKDFQPQPLQIEPHLETALDKIRGLMP